MPSPADYIVIHPLDDSPEPKCSLDGLGTLAMTLSTRLSLFCLRFYMIGMMLAVIYRIVQLILH